MGRCMLSGLERTTEVTPGGIVITSGIGRKPGQTRLELVQTNVNIIKSIASEIVKYAPNAIYILVANPVDILTYAFLKYTGLPKNQVFGTGTVLDTIRLRTRLAEIYNINKQQVHANVLGEHGDSSVIPWSIANISNVPVAEYGSSFTRSGIVIPPELNLDEVEDYVRKSGARVIERKGATFYAVSMSVCHICKCLLSGIDTTMTVATMLHGEYGIDDVAMSLLTVVGRNGAHSKVMLPLTDAEIWALHKSAESLKEIIGQTNI